MLTLFLGYSLIFYTVLKKVWDGGIISSLKGLQEIISNRTALEPGYFRGGRFNIFRYLITHGFLFLFAFFGSMLIRKYFRKISSPEIFFLAFFMLTLVIDTFSILQIYRIVLGMTPYWGVIATRIVHFGHFSGIFCLFIGSLFSLSIQYQKFGILLGIVMLISAIIVYLIPVNQTVLYNNLLFKVDIETGFYFVYYSISFFLIINYIFSLITTQNPDKMVAAVCALLIIGSREVIFFNLSIHFLLPAFLMLLLGCFLFGWRYKKSYMWE